jgi:hypothetical protein
MIGQYWKAGTAFESVKPSEFFASPMKVLIAGSAISVRIPLHRIDMPLHQIDMSRYPCNI